MEKFKVLSKESVDKREHHISEYWNDIDLLHKSVESRCGCEKYVFYEGPPTANGRPGIHHVLARTLKDLTCRYKTMKGYQVKRKAGWDTHGLPVEIEVEKKLDLHNKQDIEKYGIEDFNKKCRESVFEYEKEWRELTERMAYLVDLDNPYITLEDNYIESVWHILDSMFKDGLIYEGHKILPYCPRCGTGLASHEVAQGYQMTKSQTATVKFKLKGKDEYFLAWTTTPWTLASNVSLTVNPTVTYGKVKYNGEVYYLAEALISQVFEKPEEVEVLEKMTGKDLEYVEYEQLLPFIKADKKAFFVTLADYVTIEDGTGIVHTAPAFGEDDYQTGRRYDLPVLNPVNEEGKYTDTPWKGMFVIDADEDVIKYLRENGLLFKKQAMEHNYPHCWRCGTPLIYYAHPSWYIEVTKFKDKLIENNNGVNWFPDFVGEKRFGNWLENLNDWAISRSRYWGTPLPLWRCSCGNVRSIGSKEELVKEAIEDIDESVELHRPYVDNVHLKCDKCGKEMTREKDVIDVWFDSGAMPFAQWHYPFEHKDDFDQLFPADFICEGIDQTRGWFYSLLAISTYVTGKSPYKNVLVNDLILDKYGKKMSKSKGNTVNPFELFNQYGADVVRWYLIYVSPPWAPTKFDEDGLREVESKFFRSLRNIYNFFSLYANTDGIDPRDMNVDEKDYTLIDKWFISKYNSLVKSVNEDMEIFELTKVVRDIQDFVIEDFSNWYIRRNRRRFWKPEMDAEKMAVYKVTYDVLLGISKLIAPIAPFISEELFKSLTDKESVHLEDYPTADESKINKALEDKMEKVRHIVTLGRASREEKRIKIRQALKEVVLDGSLKEEIGSLKDLIKEELNVKEVIFENDLTKFMEYELKPNFKVVGKILGSKIKEFQNYLQTVDAKDFVSKLTKEPVILKLNGEDTEINEEFIDIKINSKEGFDVTMENNQFVILDTELTPELIEEGLVREFISKVQQLRKSKDLDILDNIEIIYSSDEEVKSAIDKNIDFIGQETLAKSVVNGAGEEEFDLNGHPITIEIRVID